VLAITLPYKPVMYVSPAPDNLPENPAFRKPVLRAVKCAPGSALGRLIDERNVPAKPPFGQKIGRNPSVFASLSQ
jgi:hypothetical protein